MRPTFVLGAALLGAALVVGGCGGASQDKSDADLGDEAATCWAEVILDEVGADAVRDLDLTSDAPPAELEDDLARAGQAARATCDLDP